MIDVRKLAKHYGSQRVLDDVTLTLRDGEITCLLGPNGAGKSTLLSAVAGVVRPDSGSIEVDGAPLRSSPVPLKTVAAVVDHDGLHPGRTARNHLRWVAHCCGLPASRADAILRLVGLESVATRRAGSFSLGMRQRLLIGAALMPDAGTLLFDEPINGLDVDGIIWLRQLLRHLAREGRCVVISTHLLGEVEKVADRVVLIGGGRVLADGTVAEVSAGYADLEQAYVALTRGAVSFGKVASS